MSKRTARRSNRSIGQACLSLALTLVMVYGLKGPASAQSTADTKNTIILMQPCCPMDTLDPAHPLNQSGLRQAPNFLIYDRLIHVTPTGQLTPGLAVSWQFVGGDTREFVLKLRPGVRFHDNTPLDAAAVKANFERQKALGTKASAAIQSLTSILTAIEVVDPSTVRLRLTKGLGSLPFMLSLQPGMMVSPAALNMTDVGGRPIGAGPFQVREWVAKERLVVTRFEGYWDSTQNRPGGFDVRFVASSDARLNAVRSGQADVVSIEPHQLADARGAGIEVSNLPTQDMWTIYMKTKSGPLGDLRVRRAIMYSLDRKLIAQDILSGAGSPTQQIFSAGHPLHIGDMSQRYPYDLARARALLAEAGFPNGLTLSLQVANIAERTRIAETVVAMLAESGIKIDLRVRDINQFVMFSRGVDDMLVGAGGSRADPLGTIDVLVGPISAFLPDGTISKLFDDKLLQVRALSSDDVKRQTLLRELNAEILDKVAWSPLAVRNDTYAFKKGCIAGFDPRLAETQEWRRLTLSTGCKR